MGTCGFLKGAAFFHFCWNTWSIASSSRG